MRQLLELGTWGHLINLCGRDFPIKTNQYIEDYAKKLGNSSDITTVVTKPDNQKYKRVSISQYQSLELSDERIEELLENGYRKKHKNWSGKVINNS